MCNKCIDKAMDEAMDDAIENAFDEFLKEVEQTKKEYDSKQNEKEYYKKNGIECIDYVESHNMCFNSGNVVKYVTRFKEKHKENKEEQMEDLKKAEYYLNRLKNSL